MNHDVMFSSKTDKRANTLETFRRYIQEIPKKLRQNYIYKVGLKYGNVTDKEIPLFHAQNRYRESGRKRETAEKCRQS